MMKRYVKIIVISIIIGFGFKFISDQIMIINDQTINRVKSNYGNNEAYEIPHYFQFYKIKFNVYSYENGWDLQKTFTIDKEELTNNQFIVYFEEQSDRTVLNHELIYPDNQTSIIEQVYSSDYFEKQSDSIYHYKIYSIYERKVNYDENPLTMFIRYKENGEEVGKIFSGYINRFNEHDANFNDYELHYPIKIKGQTETTLVTYQLIKY